MQRGNLYLIGPMGAGKTTCGAKIAKSLNWQFIDIDQQIEQQTNMSITCLFAQYGELYFRQLETKILEQFSKQKKQVISTGGGIVLSQYNSKIMRNSGIIFYLKLGVEKQYQRLKNCQNRPLLANHKNIIIKLTQLAKQRNHLYTNIADYTIDASVNNYNSEILEYFNLYFSSYNA
jgi:shikimate kinase